MAPLSHPSNSATHPTSATPGPSQTGGRPARPARGRARSGGHSGHGGSGGSGGHRGGPRRGSSFPRRPARPPLPTREPRPPAESFEAAGLPPKLVRALAERGITAPFPVQAAALPDVLAGENVLGRARTGSGKTLGFGLPMLARLAGRGQATPLRPRGLILVPTRELAQQVSDALDPLSRSLGLWLRPVYGGTSISRQISVMRRGVHIVVATPGRLIDLMERGACQLDDVETIVLDEADYMCDLGFLPAVRTILDATSPTGQRLMFSATLDREVEVLVREYLPEPVLVAVDSEVSQVATLRRHALEAADKFRQLEVVTALAGGAGRTLVFVRTQRDADHVAADLRRAGVPAEPLHGGLPQGARTRALAGFADGTRRVLVATDVAARGIHVDDVRLVVHLGPPEDAKTYQHRGGRTARAGADGADVLVTLAADRGKVRAMLRTAGVEATITSVTPSDPLVAEIAGPPAPPVEPGSLPAPRPQSEPRRAGPRFGGSGHGEARQGGERAGRGGGFGHRGAAGGRMSRDGRGAPRRGPRLDRPHHDDRLDGDPTTTVAGHPSRPRRHRRSGRRLSLVPILRFPNRQPGRQGEHRILSGPRRRHRRRIRSSRHGPARGPCRQGCRGRAGSGARCCRARSRCRSR
ncbi:DEAD/DEAH box helicase [Frankia nepalensis]|uniref:DEAD/DEAH box helicase n=1 Tax=Frankia nepalensis TaxID=1836974 RepID=UPI003899038F